MTFHEAVARAWDRLPQRQNIGAQRNAAAAQYIAGSALFPNAPSLTGSYINDNMLGSANDFITSQVELSTPIWLPGEGTATQQVARARGEAVGAEADAMHLAVAMQVLNLSAQAALAADAREVAAQRLAAARALDADAAHRFHVGESPESDALAADAEAASAQIGLTDAEAQLAAARASLAELLGEDTVPRLNAPPPPAPPGNNPIAHHPRIAAAERAVMVAQANLRLVGIQDRDDPEIGFQGINEKQPGTPWDTRFGVVVHIPFATEARNAPRRAAAEEQLTQAEARLEQTRRQIVAQYRAANATLLAAEQAKALASQAASEQQRRRGMVARAWRVGEMPLIEVIRADALAFDAQLAQERSRTALDAARLRVSLTEGVLP